MSYLYLLDTNILSELIRHPQGRIFEYIAEVGEDKVYTSIVAACELKFGAAKGCSESIKQQVSKTLDALPILPLTSPVEVRYAALRVYLEQAGTPIGPNDLPIASQALTLGLVVVTANVREFERVPDLSVENWLI
ncbi:MAG: type II toxin-antitoxin system VapC family toxin [Cyanobacteria bacterium J06628_6]